MTFQSAIMESGTHTFRGRPADPGVSFRQLTAAMSCNATTDPSTILSCLRAIPASTIRDYNEQNRVAWGPIFDNLTSHSTARTNRLTKTNFAAVPVIGGSNANEGRLYSVSATNNSAFILGLFPLFNQSQIDGLLALYPLGTGEFADDFERLAAIYTDFVFQCPCALVHNETSQVGVPSHRYYYNASFASSQLFENAGAYHASEIGVVLGTYNRTGATEFQSELSRGLQKLWADFARDPWGFGDQGWEKGAASMAVLGGGVRAEDGPDARGSILEEVGSEVISMVDKRCALYQPIYDLLGR
jgi:carboxylesterase type B